MSCRAEGLRHWMIYPSPYQPLSEEVVTLPVTRCMVPVWPTQSLFEILDSWLYILESLEPSMRYRIAREQHGIDTIPGCRSHRRVILWCHTKANLVCLGQRNFLACKTLGAVNWSLYVTTAFRGNLWCPAVDTFSVKLRPVARQSWSLPGIWETSEWSLNLEVAGPIYLHRDKLRQLLLNLK